MAARPLWPHHPGTSPWNAPKREKLAHPLVPPLGCRDPIYCCTKSYKSANRWRATVHGGIARGGCPRVQRRGGPHPRPRRGPRRSRGAEPATRPHRRVPVLLEGAIDLAHAAGANLGDDPVGTELGAERKSHAKENKALLHRHEDERERTGRPGIRSPVCESGCRKRVHAPNLPCSSEKYNREL